MPWGAAPAETESTADSPILHSGCQMHILDPPFLSQKGLCPYENNPHKIMWSFAVPS